MPYKKILLATDGSDHALHAATQTAALAKDMGAEVEVLSVAVIHPSYGGLHMGAAAVQGEESEVEQAAAMAARDTAAVLLEQGVEARTVVVLAMSNPAHAICEEADDFGADLIVIGSRGLGRTGTLLMGSTSQQVLHCSKLPVLAVR